MGQRHSFLVRLLPVFCPRPWGRHSLEPFFVNPVEDGPPIGEVWLSSLDCRIQGLAGGTVEGLWGRMRAAERGAAVAGLGRFPLLVKILFTAEKLSVQVHPDDDFARRHEGEPWGKNEVWYVLEAEPGAWVRCGLIQGMARSGLDALLKTPAAENALQCIPVRLGDIVSVPAGTLHSIGPGLVLCEIQQYSDVTYRVYDYDRLGLDGRQRPLHLEKARAALKLETPGAGLCSAVPLEGCRDGRVLFSGSRFVVQHFSSATRLDLHSDSSHLDLIIMLAGAGAIRAAGGEMEFKRGDTFLVSAEAEGIEVAPIEPSQWLRTFPVGQWQ